MKHGFYKTRFYQIWEGVKKRCQNQNCLRFKDYGGRGIQVCEDWNDFVLFKRDMYEEYKIKCKLNGEKDTTLDRLDNDKGYFKENCRWATRKEQTPNRKSLIKLTFKNETLTLAQWAERIGINAYTIYQRIGYGFPIGKILSRKNLLLEYRNQKQRKR